MQQLPFGEFPVTAECRPKQQYPAAGTFVRNVVYHLVEQLLLVHRQVIERQQFAPLEVVFGIQLQEHLQQCRRHLEIVDQEVVDGRGTDQFERSLRIAVAPFEVDLFVLGQQPRKPLECLVTFIAGIFDIPGGLQLTGVCQNPGEIIRPVADDFESLVGRGVKICFLHRGAF